MTRTRSLRRIYALALGAAGLALLAAGLVPAGGHAALNGPSLLDLALFAVAAAGVALTTAAVRVAFGRTRRRTKLLALPLVLLLVQFYVFPVLITGTVATNAARKAGPAAASLAIPGAEDVRFTAADGVALTGWFVPGRTPATVMLLHGSHGTRASTTAYLRMLHAAGYTVLAYDARGHGASGGHENAYGWYGDRDLWAAVRYLRSRGIRRVAALGLSMGGEEALRAAANGVPLRALVADGAGASTTGDMREEAGGGDALLGAVTWIGMRTVELFSGDREPPSLASIVGRIRIPALLIASNRRNERRIDSVFAARIGPSARLWYVADAGHTQAFARHPEQYRQRVLAFLANALR